MATDVFLRNEELGYAALISVLFNTSIILVSPMI